MQFSLSMNWWTVVVCLNQEETKQEKGLNLRMTAENTEGSMLKRNHECTDHCQGFHSSDLQLLQTLVHCGGEPHTRQ